MVEVKLSQSSTARKKIFEVDFSELEIKGRGARGNTITKYPVRKVDKLKSGVSTLSGIELWFEESAGRLNKDKRGKHVGISFRARSKSQLAKTITTKPRVM